jgi:hypothetical protein
VVQHDEKENLKLGAVREQGLELLVADAVVEKPELAEAAVAACARAAKQQQRHGKCSLACVMTR